jgi:FHA domain
MSLTCPNGHLSMTTDYCDQCGAPLADQPAAAVADPDPGSQAVAPLLAEAETSLDTTPSLPTEPCPRCDAPRIGSDKFCESCGYNFVTGEPGEAKPSVVDPQPATEPWEALISADRDYFERVGTEQLEFPAHCQPRTFLLDQPEIGIGRESPSRGIRPEIDLSGAPEDLAISHLHAILVRQHDGSYALLDPGSSNGTTLNDDPTPIAANAPVPLADGDRIHLGAWTTVTIRRATTAPSSDA